MTPQKLPDKLYINELHIERYKVLEDINIKFCIPENGKNALNILAGPNGTGKTSLLNLIFDSFRLSEHPKESIIFDFRFSDNIIAQKVKESSLISINILKILSSFGIGIAYKTPDKYENGIHTSPRIIYLPNKLAFIYKESSRLNTAEYNFHNLIDSGSIIGNAELYIREFIIAKERQSTNADPKGRTKDAVDNFNAIFHDTDFVTKLVDIDPYDNNRPLFETINHEKVKIDALSDGEKQLYGRVISLLMLNPHYSLILIDEPEVGLHPKWQYTIMDIYKNIGKNNQFIIATHSPHIIAKAHYKELVLLKKDGEKIVVEQFDRPPAACDINSVLCGIMGARYLPDEIVERHRRYRELVENGQKETPEAKALRDEILEYEPEESEFMQSIRFYEELNS